MPRWMKTLAAVLGGLLVLFLLLKMPHGGSGPSLPPFPATPAKLEIVSPAGGVTLEKEGAAWRLTSPLAWPADPQAVAELLGSLSRLTAESVLTTRQETYPQYEVTESSGVRVTAWEGGKPSSYVFGKMSSDYTRIYARVPDKPEVFLARGPRREDLERSLSAWRDRRLLALSDAETVESVGLAGEELVVSTAPEPGVERFLGMLHRLSAVEFADGADPKRFGLDKPSDRLTARLKPAGTVSFSVGRKDAKTGRWPVLRDGETTVLWVEDYEWNDVKTAWKTRKEAN